MTTNTETENEKAKSLGIKAGSNAAEWAIQDLWGGRSMKKTTLRDSLTFWPDRIAPFSVTMKAEEEVFLILDEGERVLLSLSAEPTPGDSRWISRELVTA